LKVPFQNLAWNHFVVQALRYIVALTSFIHQNWAFISHAQNFH
jgi:hypothetical protein